MTTEEMLLSLLINIAASIIFTFLLYISLRPNLKISPYIVRKEIDGNTKYQFKIINRSLFPAYNVKIELNVRKLISTGNDQFHIQYMKYDIDIPNVKRLYPTSFKSNVALYAIIISTKNNLAVILADPMNTLELTIDSTHALSAFSKIFIQNFSTTTVLTDGFFKFGNNTGVTTNNRQ